MPTAHSANHTQDVSGERYIVGLEEEPMFKKSYEVRMSRIVCIVCNVDNALNSVMGLKFFLYFANTKKRSLVSAESRHVSSLGNHQVSNIYE